MNRKHQVASTSKPRQTVRRTTEYKARLSESSAILAEKMEEKRSEWVLK